MAHGAAPLFNPAASYRGGHYFGMIRFPERHRGNSKGVNE